ncbi:MAG: ATP-binding protein [Actinomycetota bacterium]|nr:ATP-binding protein [Actinomycetota bacterium]
MKEIKVETAGGPPAAFGQFGVRLNVPAGSAASAVQCAWFDLHASGQLPHTEVVSLRKSVDWRALFGDDWSIKRSATARNSSTVLAVRDGVTALYDGSRMMTSLSISTECPEQLESVVVEMRARHDELVGPPPEGVSPVQLWFASHGQGAPATSTDRRLESLPWDASRGNYPHEVRARLERLMVYDEPLDASARLILWHGRPGTGKTSAIRSLIDAWEPWCATQYVSDPDQFFARADYISTVLTSRRALRPWRAQDTVTERDWALVIAEDCDEYLRPQARGSAGASLGRLLNLTDGLLGRGMKVLVLLTTNEPVGRLHPAITRPGRCLDVTEFTEFSAAEASARLDRPVAASMTLAEIYEELNGSPPPLRHRLDDVTTGHYL